MYWCLNNRALGLSLPVRQTLELAASAGFGGIDFMLRDLLEEGVDPAEARTMADDLGLRAGAWPLPVDWRGDRDRFELDLAQLPRFAEAAAVLGATRTGTWVMPETPRDGSSRLKSALGADHGLDSQTERAATAAFHGDRLGAIARVLADFGIQLGLEVIGVESFRTGGGVPFVTRLGELGPWLGSLLCDYPNVGILLDAFHLYAAKEGIEAGLVWGVDRVVWVHVADLPAKWGGDRGTILDHDRGLPGENGAVGVAPFLQRLVDEGYKGPVTPEPGARCQSLLGRPAEEIVRLVAEAMRSVWPSPVPYRERG